MKLLKNVIRELLKVRGIKQPYKYVSDIEYEKLDKKRYGKKTDQRLIRNKLAKRLDVPTSFIKRILEYEELNK